MAVVTTRAYTPELEAAYVARRRRASTTCSA